MAMAALPEPGYALDPETGVPTAAILPPELRLLTPFMNVTGAFALILGALFSAYVFMPKKRVLDYSLDPGQSGDQFLFNLFIAPIAIIVNFVASLPGALKALFTGRIHSRVPATLLIAIGAFIPALTDSLNRFGSTEWFQTGQAPEHALPARRLPRLDRDVQRDPGAVHIHRAAGRQDRGAGSDRPLNRPGADRHRSGLLAGRGRLRHPADGGPLRR